MSLLEYQTFYDTTNTSIVSHDRITYFITDIMKTIKLNFL